MKSEAAVRGCVRLSTGDGDHSGMGTDVMLSVDRSSRGVEMDRAGTTPEPLEAEAEVGAAPAVGGGVAAEDETEEEVGKAVWSVSGEERGSEVGDAELLIAEAEAEANAEAEVVGGAPALTLFSSSNKFTATAEAEVAVAVAVAARLASTILRLILRGAGVMACAAADAAAERGLARALWGVAITPPPAPLAAGSSSVCIGILNADAAAAEEGVGDGEPVICRSDRPCNASLAAAFIALL